MSNPSIKSIFSFPDRPIEESDDILSPEALIEKYKTFQESFAGYRFLFEHLLQVMGTPEFQGWGKEYRDQFLYQYHNISSLVFDIERHAEDHFTSYAIVNYLRCVRKQTEEETSQDREFLSAMENKYGSIRNAIANLQAHHYGRPLKADKDQEEE